MKLKLIPQTGRTDELIPELRREIGVNASLSQDVKEQNVVLIQEE